VPVRRKDAQAYLGLKQRAGSRRRVRQQWISHHVVDALRAFPSTITIAIFGALVIFGIISFVQLGRSSSPPNTDFPVVAVYASYPGASPQDMERMVIKPIEDQMSGIDHLDELTANAQEGTAIVVVQFKMGTDLNLAAVDVQRRVDIARSTCPPTSTRPS